MRRTLQSYIYYSILASVLCLTTWPPHQYVDLWVLWHVIPNNPPCTECMPNPPRWWGGEELYLLANPLELILNRDGCAFRCKRHEFKEQTHHNSNNNLFNPYILKYQHSCLDCSYHNNIDYLHNKPYWTDRKWVYLHNW